MPTICDIAEFTPPMDELYYNMTKSQSILLGIGTTLVCGISILCGVQLFMIWKTVRLEESRNKLTIMAFIYPVIGVFSLANMISPRTHAILASFGTLYIMFSLYNLVTLSRVLYHGRKNLSEALQEEDQMLGTRVPPLCCCIPCMPRLNPTAANLERFEKIVLQAILFRCVIGFINVFLLAEFGHSAERIIQFVDLCGLPSILLGVFGVQVLIRVRTERLTEYRMMWMFYLIIAPLPLFSLQFPLIFKQIFLRLRMFPCGPYMTPTMNAQYVFNFVLIVELFLLSVMITILYHAERARVLEKRRNEELLNPCALEKCDKEERC